MASRGLVLARDCGSASSAPTGLKAQGSMRHVRPSGAGQVDVTPRDRIRGHEHTIAA